MNPKETVTVEPVIEKLTPIGYRVLVSIYKKPTSSASGLALPETENTVMPVKGQIVGLGRKTLIQKLAIIFGFKQKFKVGQWIYFRKYAIDMITVTTSEGDLTIYTLEENEILDLVN